MERLASEGSLSQRESTRKQSSKRQKSSKVEVNVTKKGKTEKEKLHSVSITRIFSLCKKEWPYFIPGIIAAIINGGQMPVWGLLLADISVALFAVDSDQLRDEANYYALLFLIAGIVVGIANFVQFWAFGIIAEKLTKRVRRLLFTSMLKQEISFFDEEKNSVGALSAGLSTDAALVKANVSDRTSLAIMNLVTVVVGLFIAFYNGWQLTLVLLVLFPLLAISGVYQMLAMTSASKEEEKYMGPAAAVLQESISGIRTVTSFGLKSKVVELYKEQLSVPMKLGTKKGLVLGVGFGFSQGILFALYSVAFFIGALLIDGGRMEFDEMLRVFFAVLLTGMGLGQSMALAPDVAKGSLAVSNVFKIVDRKSKIDPTEEEGVKSIGNEYNATFSNVKFNYPVRPDAEIFSDLSLKIEPGTTVALVGSSGSGKSTVIALLERFYDPIEGKIEVGSNNQPLKAVNVSWWRDSIALVEQEPKLFALSIKENIKFGAPDEVQVTDEMIVDAAKAANAHDFITSFPNGYDTLVGEQGTQLSGGQKQRICIARAILKQPKMLLLDEATSALDNKSEKVVQAALDKLVEKGTMTTVVIAHRLTTVQNADKIIVMAHGKVVEEGTHSDLIKLEGTYFKLWNAQNKSKK